MHNRAEMRTQRQIEASRINGAKSRGPVTHAGRLKSSRNSRRHCLYARDIPACSTPAPIPEPEAAPLATQSPSDFLTQAALSAYEGLKRIWDLETRILNEEAARQRLIHPSETETTILAFAYGRLADETGTMHALYRFEGVALRRWHRALDRIDRWNSRQPAAFFTAQIEKNEIRETNPTRSPETAFDESEKSKNCGTNPSRPHRGRMAGPKQAYNRRVATHAPADYKANDEAVRCRILDPSRIYLPGGPRPGPHSLHEATHAGPHSPRLQRNHPHRQSRRAFG
jgi:hypothetical protein